MSVKTANDGPIAETRDDHPDPQDRTIRVGAAGWSAGTGRPRGATIETTMSDLVPVGPRHDLAGRRRAHDQRRQERQEVVAGLRGARALHRPGTSAAGR